MKQLELRDFLEYKFLSEVKYSPSGERAAFVVSEADSDETGYESSIWLIEGDSVRRLTAGGSESSFIWESDETILFAAKRSKKEKERASKGEEFSVFYRIDINGGEAVKAFELGAAAREVLPMGGGKYAVVAGIDSRYPDYYKASKEERKNIDKAHREYKDECQVYEEVAFWSNGAGVMAYRRSALFIYDSEADKLERVTEPQFSVTRALRCEKGIVYYGAKKEHTPPLFDEVYLFDGQTKQLLENDTLRLHGLCIADDGVMLAGAATDRYGINENPHFYTLSFEGELKKIAEYDYSIGSSVGSDCRLGGGGRTAYTGGKWYFTTTREGASHLYCIDKTGKIETVCTREGSIDCFDAKGGEATAVCMYDGGLQEIYTIDLKDGKVCKKTSFNDAALEGKYVASYEKLTVISGGTPITGWVLKPKDYDPEKTYPAVLDIHGGPKTAFGEVFYHEMQVWANMGYFVFFCNPTGSDGRDNAFMDIRGRYGEVDYENIMDFTDAVLEAWPRIDSKRVCVTGGSYGGFMTNWAIGHTDRFCCAATQRSISNWVSFWGISDIGVYFAPDQTAGDIYDDPERLWKHSPLKYVKNVKTPTLFIHSDEDYRCPIEEGIQFFTALRQMGVEARFCRFRGENHELSRSGKPKNRVRRLSEMTDWFEKYAK